MSNNDYDYIKRLNTILDNLENLYSIGRDELERIVMEDDSAYRTNNIAKMLDTSSKNANAQIANINALREWTETLARLSVYELRGYVNEVVSNAIIPILERLGADSLEVRQEIYSAMKTLITQKEIGK
jgi:hypothetical protein